MLTKLFSTFDRTYSNLLGILAAKNEEVEKVTAERDAAEKEIQNLRLRLQVLEMTKVEYNPQ